MNYVNIGNQIECGIKVPSLDAKYGPYTSLEEARQAIETTFFAKTAGLTVGIKDSNTGKITEYWFQPNENNELQLVKKNQDITVDTILNGGSSNPVANKTVKLGIDEVKNYVDETFYNRNEVKKLLSGIAGLRYEEVTSLPSNPESNVVYLVKEQLNDIYEMWVYISPNKAGGEWVFLGTTTLELNGYVTVEELENNYYDSSQIDNRLAGKQNVISNLDVIQTGAALGATAYQLPENGIPYGDLALGIKTSLGKADSAVQEAPIDGDKYVRQGGQWMPLGNVTPGGSVSNYNDLNGLPSINGIQLTGNKSLSDLGIQAAINNLDDIIQGAADGSQAKIAVNGIVSANDGSITIRKIGNGTTTVLGAFTVNQDRDEIIDIPIPTSVAELGGLPVSTKYGAKLELSLDTTTYTITAKLKDQNNDDLSTAIIDLPLESVVVGGSYNSVTESLVLTLNNNGTISIPISELVSGLQPMLQFDNAPIANSDNPVKSSGIKNALDLKQDSASAVRSITKLGHTYMPNSGDVVIPADITSAQATTLEAGQNATATVDNNQVLRLGIPKGADAISPFKGWYDAVITGEAGSQAITSETQNLPANPVVGDYAYVKTIEITGTAPEQTETPIVKIYECSTNDTWSDSGRTFNPENNQEFASGQDLNTVNIVNDLTTGGANNVASADIVKQLNKTKLDNSLNDDTFYIVDDYDNVIANIDAEGVHSVDYSYKDSDDALADEQGNVSLKEKLSALDDSKLDAEVDGSAFYFTDSDGYIICKIDTDGVHAPNIKESTSANVACMVISENYYPTAKPTRDSKGFVTSMNVMFETGVSGTISFNYDNTETRNKGNISSISVTYGANSYTITIIRDNSGNVNTISIE